MFLKSLTIYDGNGKTIRDIQFRQGINLIVDETPNVTGKETGNGVGKTTVLKLVDFCLGGSPKEIYIDPENRRTEYQLVKDFLKNNKVTVSLILTDDLLTENAHEIKIVRNFLNYKERMQFINGKDITDDEFEKELTNILLPGHYEKKPTFRQIIAHNIRYKEISIENTLKTLDKYTKDEEYERLYLFLFGCDYEQVGNKDELLAKIKYENNFKERLEGEQTKSSYESALALIESDIKELEGKKSSLNLNPNFESDLEALNETKYNINYISSDINRLNLRKKLILEAQKEMQSGVSNINPMELKQIYEQATSLVGNVQRTFQELLEFHNKMIDSKIRFITKDLPGLEKEITNKNAHLKRLLIEETNLKNKIIQSDSFEMLEQIITELNDKYHTKGAYENTIKQLNSVEEMLTSLNDELSIIDNELFSADFSTKIQLQLNKFNRHFALVSQDLYGERYIINYRKKEYKSKRVYEFFPDNVNFGSGKRQGEAACFDIAYILFADEENIPCMHFLMTDKKELLHDNQLIKIANLVEDKGIQFVTSILKDKLPEELNKEEYIVLSLSQNEKLFRIPD